MKDTENKPQPRKRRKWGSVIVRKDADGNPTSLQARYVNPLDPRKKVGRNFGLEYEAEAFRWLDEEHYLVTLHHKGIRQWVHPSQRRAENMPTFAEYARDYFDNYRKYDGSRLSGRSNRCNGIALRRLNETFGDMPLDRITSQMVDEWYAKAKNELTDWTFEQAARTLKRIMLAAASEQDNGAPPLIPASPCRYRVTKPQSKRRDQPPVTADEIKRMADLFPDYYRLALWLSLLVGGLRLGEVCALQLRDIDLENLQLHVRHSVNRGPDDKGKYRLCEPKTESSRRVVPIPRPLVPLIEDHISRFCKDRKPDAMLFHSCMMDEWLLPPATIERMFRTAREKIGRPDITFHSLRATHATMFVLEGGTMRETMDELGHTSVSVAVNSYQRVVREHRRETAELLAYRYLPSDDPEAIRTVIAQKERQIGKLRDEVERLRKILLERDTGIPTDPDTVLPKKRNI